MTKLDWDKVNLENLTKRRDAEFYDRNSSFLDKSDFYHPRFVHRRSKPRTPSLNWTIVSCIQCKLPIKLARLDKHYRKIHSSWLAASSQYPTSGITFTAGQINKTKAPNIALSQCPKCNVNVRIDRLEKHIRKAHRLRQGGQSQKNTLPKRRRTNKASSTNRRSNQSPVFSLWSVQVSALANELRVAPLVVMNESGRRGHKVQNASDRIPNVIADRIREYVRLTSFRKKNHN